MRPGETRRDRKIGKRRCSWISALLLAVVSLVCAASPVDRADAERPSPDQVEAAYLYNFGKFTRWPAATSGGPLVLCVAGQDAIDQILTQMVAGERIQGRPLEVKRLESTRDAGSCSILFLGAGERDWADTYLVAVSGKPVLTVSEAPDFVERGGVIQFVLSGHHVRFSVNLTAASRNGLQLSSELLKVAVSVTGKPGIGGVQ